MIFFFYDSVWGLNFNWFAYETANGEDFPGEEEFRPRFRMSAKHDRISLQLVCCVRSARLTQTVCSFHVASVKTTQSGNGVD